MAMKSPDFILVRPQLGENIGMTARALWNCQIDSLRLVAPRDGWPNPAAYDAASGADIVLDKATVFPNVQDAVADCQHVFALTARRRDLQLPNLTPQAAMQTIADYHRNGEQCALLFGPERTGLDNNDLSVAEAVITIPLNPQFSSLNLAQSVLIIAWQWWQQISQAQRLEDAIIAKGQRQNSQPAPLAEIDNVFNRLIEGMTEGGFFHNPELTPVVSRNLRVFLARANPTLQEIRTLHGVITALRAAPPKH